MVNGVKMAVMIQPMLSLNGVKNNTIPARYPTSQKKMPSPAVSLRVCCVLSGSIMIVCIYTSFE